MIEINANYMNIIIGFVESNEIFQPSASSVIRFPPTYDQVCHTPGGNDALSCQILVFFPLSALGP
jgi:hypothetical protein